MLQPLDVGTVLDLSDCDNQAAYRADAVLVQEIPQLSQLFRQRLYLNSRLLQVEKKIEKQKRKILRPNR